MAQGRFRGPPRGVGRAQAPFGMGAAIAGLFWASNITIKTAELRASLGVLSGMAGLDPYNASLLRIETSEPHSSRAIDGELGLLSKEARQHL